MSRDRNLPYYYYAGGERVPLELDTKRIAVQLENIRSPELRQEIETVLKKTERAGRSTRLRRSLVLTERRDVASNLRERLEEAGAMQPVFRRGRALMVALPEVRIEVEDRKEGSSIARMFGEKGPDVEIVRDRGAELTIRPMSGSGLDALHLANEVQETSQPLMAQVRFVRVVPKR